MLSKIRLYWLLQMMGWGGFVAILLFSMFTFVPKPLPFQPIALQFVIGASGLLVTHLYRLVAIRYRWSHLPLGRLILHILGGSFLASVVVQILVHGAMLTFLDWNSYSPIRWNEFPYYVLNIFIIILGWSIFYFLYQYWERIRQSRIDKANYERALKEAELVALKAQINPHFLFNALNNIKSLVRIDPEKSRDSISNLSEMLRYSIQHSERALVKVEEELEMAENYLLLEKIQYEERLSFEMQISEQTRQALVPPMTIQLMLENAIKHGISQIEDGGSINLNISADRQHLMIELINTGKITERKETGIGIRNILERVEILFQDQGHFALKEEENQVISTLVLPLKYESSHYRRQPAGPAGDAALA